MQTTFSHALPSTTVNQSRLKIFQATRRPIFVKEETNITSWGTVMVSGKLGQGHADVLESLMYCAEQNSIMEDGRIKILVDPYQVRMHAKISSMKQLRLIITELMMAVIRVDFISPKSSTRLICAGHLIDYMQEAVKKNGEKVTKTNPLNRLQRPLWRIELGKALTDIINNDIWQTSNPILIAELTSGISQALARFVRSHRCVPKGGWILDNVIRELTNINISNQKLRDSRREIKKDLKVLMKAGVQIVDGRVHQIRNALDLITKAKCVEQSLEGVEQSPEWVEQSPDMWSNPPVLAGFSDLTGTPLPGCIHPMQ